MTVLIAVSGSGATQGNFLTIAKHASSKTVVVDLQSSRVLHPSMSTPLWAKPFSNPSSQTLTRRYFRQLVRNHGVSQVIAIGLHTALPISRLLPDLEIDLVILQGELDFAFRPSRKRSRFLSAVGVASRLWFDDHLEMDKAVGHGSNKPHFLTPVASLPTQLWDTTREKPRIAFVFPDNWIETKVREEIDTVLDWCPPDTEKIEVTAGSLYGYQDLTLNRGFPGTFKYRLGAIPTHVVILGNSRNHLAIISAFGLAGSQRLFIDGTITNQFIARRAGIDSAHVARGAALGQRLGSNVASYKASQKLKKLSSTISSGDEALETFRRARQEPVDWWFEEGVVDPSHEYVDLFFATAPIEDRADGARPQRIRAMSEAMYREAASLVRLTANGSILRRRSLAMLYLLDKGVKPGLGYGENSTAPMPVNSLELFVPFLQRITARGLRFGWFVRDLHWLSDETDAYKDLTQDELLDMRKRGVRELDSISSVGARLFAPSHQAGEKFSKLLQQTGYKRDYTWNALPPGVSPEQTLAVTESEELDLDCLHISYTGGFSGIYDVDILFQALQEIELNWTLDLVVRPDDVPLVQEAAARLPRERISIKTGEFKNWRAKPGKNVGIVLLNSRYGNATFPFKTISYLEKRVPILSYEGGSAAEFAEAFGVGVTCKPTVKSVRHALVSLAQSEKVEEDTWQDALTQNSWAERIRKLRRELN